MGPSRKPPPIGILIRLKSRILCEALRRLLEDSRASYTAVAAHELEEYDGFRPDIVLVDDFSLKQGATFPADAAKLILVDTGLPEEDITRLLLIHKLDGVISIGTDTGLFHKALRAIHDGQVWIDNDKIRSLLRHSPHSTHSPGCERLTPKEQAIVLLIAQGLRNREIAEQLHISEQTVKCHVSRILRKADVSNRAQLVPLAMHYNLYSPQQDR